MTADIRRAVVSGAAGGIGRGLAEGFLAAGYHVTGVDRAPDGWTAEGFRYVALDISDSDAVAAFGAELDRLDVLINAAGIIRRVEEFEVETFEAVLDVNLTGTMRLSTACRPALAKEGGAIINIASMLSFQGGIRVPSYTASKSGLAGITKLLACEWASKGVNVNAIAPGYMTTDNTEALRADAKRNAQILDRIPAGRWGEASDLGGAAVFLASSASDYVHGAIIPVDGGWLAR